MDWIMLLRLAIRLIICRLKCIINNQVITKTVKTTKIEWTDKTWNPITGCTKHSAGCTHCYAEVMSCHNTATNYLLNGQNVWRNISARAKFP